MGKGNYVFRDSNNNQVPTYYIEVEEENEDWFLEDFTINLKDICKNLNIDYVNGISRISSWNQYEPIYAENKILELRLVDNEWSTAIACVPKLMEHNGCVNPMWKKSANKLMLEIHKIYGLRVRCGAWTSGTVDKEEKEFY